jgi:hypothetical protein
VAGRFATILGYEWSDSKMGHRNIYYRGTGPGQPEGVRRNTAALWSYLDVRGIRALTVPHHPNTDSQVRRADGTMTWGPMDWTEIDHEYQRIVEICQRRGSFELPGPAGGLRVRAADRGASVQTALAMGHRLGFIGSTDTHSGRPGSGAARCAIVSDVLSRQGLWDAMYDRRCYATSGKHILVFFTLNDHPMGSEIQVTAPDVVRHISWRVVGTGPLGRVDLLRNNEVVRSWPGAGSADLTGSFALDAALDSTEWWYLRIIQEDSEMAWSSPIWVDYVADPS